jgi:hypothetical protein
MTYDEWLKAMQTLCGVPLNQSDENFQRIVPRIVEYADNRIYREMTFLATLNSTTALLTSNNREVTLPSTVLVLENINVLTPVGALSNTSVRRPLERVSVAALDMFWPQASFTPGVPQKYALIGTSAVGPPQAFSFAVRMAPEPDAAYTAEFIGTVRPAPLSPANTQTYLTVTFPDLYVACCMVFASGYQRDFGAMADDPQKAMSWNLLYTGLRDGVMLEEARRRGEAPGWSEQAPAPLANQPR